MLCKSFVEVLSAIFSPQKFKALMSVHVLLLLVHKMNPFHSPDVLGNLSCHRWNVPHFDLGFKIYIIPLNNRRDFKIGKEVTSFVYWILFCTIKTLWYIFYFSQPTVVTFFLLKFQNKLLLFIFLSGRFLE